MQRGSSVLVALTVLFAGCAASEGSAADDGTGATSSINPTDPNAPTGAIRGGVYDPELVAIPGAMVAIVSVDLAAQSDENGQFALEGLAPGEYEVVAQKLGYQA